MIIITASGADREAVKQSFLREFTKMILCGVAVPRSEETILQAMAVLADELEIAETETGFMVGDEDIDNDFTVQDCAFSVAESVFGKNNYTDEFGSEQACMSYAAKQLIEQYPDIEIEARIFLDTEWSNTVELVRTEDGRIMTEIEEL